MDFIVKDRKPELNRCSLATITQYTIWVNGIEYHIKHTKKKMDHKDYDEIEDLEITRLIGNQERSDVISTFMDLQEKGGER